MLNVIYFFPLWVITRGTPGLAKNLPDFNFKNVQQYTDTKPLITWAASDY